MLDGSNQRTTQRPHRLVRLPAPKNSTEFDAALIDQLTPELVEEFGQDARTRPAWSPSGMLAKTWRAILLDTFWAGCRHLAAPRRGVGFRVAGGRGSKASQPIFLVQR